MKWICRLLVSAFCCMPFFPLQAQLTYSELTVQYDSAWTFRNLQLIPVKFTDAAKGGQGKQFSNVISLSEALKTGKLSIKEIVGPDGSDINVLVIKNHTKKTILLNSGEMVAGGKQDRVFASTTLIPPGEEENYVTVFCIEKGRWDDKVKPFTYNGLADIQLRKQLALGPKQNEIWKQIDSQFHAKKLNADTWSYLKLYKNVSVADTAYLHYFRERMQQSDSSFAGFIAISGKHIINCELFGSEALCLLSYLDLVKSYVHGLSATDEPPKVNIETIRNFTGLFMQSNEQQEKYIATHGKADRFQGHIIHLVAFPN